MSLRSSCFWSWLAWFFLFRHIALSAFSLLVWCPNLGPAALVLPHVSIRPDFRCSLLVLFYSFSMVSGWCAFQPPVACFSSQVVDSVPSVAAVVWLLHSPASSRTVSSSPISCSIFFSRRPGWWVAWFSPVCILSSSSIVAVGSVFGGSCFPAHGSVLSFLAVVCLPRPK